MSGDGMSGFITTLTATGNLTPETIWAQLGELAPLIATLTVVAIGVYFLRRVLKKASKAKGGI